MESISMNDWIALAVGIIGIIVGLLKSIAPRLPKAVQTVIAKLGQDEIIKIIEWCQTHVATTEQRRETAVSMIKEAWFKISGTALPNSIANLIVEWGVAVYKRKRK